MGWSMYHPGDRQVQGMALPKIAADTSAWKRAWKKLFPWTRVRPVEVRVRHEASGVEGWSPEDGAMVGIRIKERYFLRSGTLNGRRFSVEVPDRAEEVFAVDPLQHFPLALSSVKSRATEPP